MQQIESQSIYLVNKKKEIIFTERGSYVVGALEEKVDCDFQL